MEQAVHDRGAARVGQQFALIADQATRRCMENQPLAARTGRAHVLQLGLALRQLLNDRTGELLVDVDDDFLDRLQPLTRFGILLHHHPRAADRQLEALAAHGLDKDRQLQFAAAGNLEGFRRPGLAPLAPHCPRLPSSAGRG
jgi:hypothetical protein